MIRIASVAFAGSSIHPGGGALRSLRGDSRFDFVMLTEGQTEFQSALSLYSGLQDDHERTTSMLSITLPKNLNVPWVAATSLAVWFFFVHTPPFWVRRKLLARDSLLAVHILAAGTIYLACAHNCMVTPSSTAFGTRSKFMHTWVGRVGMVSGVISFVLGAFLSWSRLGKVGEGGTSLGFALPISIGGIAQLFAQYNGYMAIKKYKLLKQDIETQREEGKRNRVSKKEQIKRAQDIEVLQIEQRKALRLHIGNMISLFVSACGIPAGIRLAELATGGKDGLATVVAIVAVIGVLNKIAYRYMRAMKPELIVSSHLD